ncbi:unnamed protein product, partial [Ectocarpus sp. 12 AP-2014]
PNTPSAGISTARIRTPSTPSLLLLSPPAVSPSLTITAGCSSWLLLGRTTPILPHLRRPLPAPPTPPGLALPTRPAAAMAARPSSPISLPPVSHRAPGLNLRVVSLSKVLPTRHTHTPTAASPYTAELG